MTDFPVRPIVMPADLKHAMNGLLRKDVLASRDGIEADLVVRVIRRRDDHSVDFRICEHLFVVEGSLDRRPVLFALVQEAARQMRA